MNWQANIWSPNVREVQGSARHRPEAWTGDLEREPIIFLARKGGSRPNAPWVNMNLVHEDLLSYWRSKLTDWDRIRPLMSLKSPISTKDDSERRSV